MSRLTLIAVSVVVLIACTPTNIALLPSPSAASQVTDMPTTVLELTTGPGDLPGVSPAQPGGISEKGPISVASDGAGVYLWDQANLRLLYYERGRLVRSVSLAEAPRESVALLVQQGRAYLREQDDVGRPIGEHAFDLEFGRRVETVRTDSGRASIYPRNRIALAAVTDLQKGGMQSLGVDSAGARYDRFVPKACNGPCVEIRRIEPDGAVSRRGLIDLGGRYEDLSVAADGAVLALLWERDGRGRIVGVTVQRLIAARGT